MNEPILTISTAAKLLKVHPRTLMLYERANIFTPYRTKTQRRLYSLKDLDLLQFVKYLTQVRGVNLRGVKVLLDAFELAEKEGCQLQKKLLPDFKPSRLT